MKSAYKLGLLFSSVMMLVGLVAIVSPSSAYTLRLSDSSLLSPDVDAQYGAWEQSGPALPPNSFDINQCFPLHVGDVNGDGLTDLICPRYLGSSIQRTWTEVQLSTSTGFSEWQTASPPTDDDNFTLIYCSTIEVADVNGDMLSDLICPYDHGQQSTTTYVQLASPPGFTGWLPFSPTQPLFTFEIGACNTLKVGDVNGDGMTDLICPYVYPSGQISMFVQLASPTGFSGWQPSGPVNPPGTFYMDQCTTLGVGDVNGDGLDDLICPYDYGETATTFVKISSEAGFSDWQASGPEHQDFDLDGCVSQQVGDLNGDGWSDLICPYDLGGGSMMVQVQIATSNGFLAWQASGPENPPATFNLDQCKGLKVGDVNGDGLSDLICAYDYGDTTTTFVKVTSPDGFSEWQPSEFPQFAFDLDGCTPVHKGDLNGDGLTDLICAYDYGDSATTTFVQMREVSSQNVYAPFFVR